MYKVGQTVKSVSKKVRKVVGVTRKGFVLWTSKDGKKGKCSKLSMNAFKYR